MEISDVSDFAESDLRKGPAASVSELGVISDLGDRNFENQRDLPMF
jgi:hypothetical protein